MCQNVALAQRVSLAYDMTHQVTKMPGNHVHVIKIKMKDYVNGGLPGLPMDGSPPQNLICKQAHSVHIFVNCHYMLLLKFYLLNS